VVAYRANPITGKGYILNQITYFSQRAINQKPNKNSGAIVTYLANEPNKDILQSDELEMKAKHYLGIDSFGDPEEQKKDIFKHQIKRVPKLEMPDLRVKVE
jgi:hypothetical protein